MLKAKNNENAKMFRKRCAFCSTSRPLETLFSLDEFPIFMGCTENEKSDDIIEDMTFTICIECGGVQLNPYADPTLVYKTPHGSGTVGPSWSLHHTELAKFISKYSPEEVLEVGASHDYLARSYLKISDNTKWEVIDPNPPIENEDSRLNYKKGFFDESYTSDKNYDCIVHSHTYEHFINISEITCKFSSMLNENGIMIFSVPHLQGHYDCLFTNVMNFEHTIFLSETMIDFVLKRSGFVIEEKKYHQNNHSIFYACRKQSNMKQNLTSNFYHLNKASLINWYESHMTMVKHLNDKIRKTKGDIYLFGAHVTSQFLIALGLDTDRIICVLDNDKKKHGKRLYGTSFTCKSPVSVLSEREISVILRGGVFAKDIEKGITSKAKSPVTFIKG